MRLGRWAIVVSFSCSALADSAATVNSVVATVRASMARKRGDAEAAASLGKVKLTQSLTERVIEILESEGAGPLTLGALQQMRDASRLLPAPPEDPPGMAPPPPPSLEEGRLLWESAGARAVDYTNSLPNFVCTETIHRWVDPNGHEEWQTASTVVADLTFFERKEQYKVLTVDGKPSSKPLLEVGGTVSQGEFGSMLAMIFDSSSRTEHRWDHWTVLRKRPTSVYFFHIPASKRPQFLHSRTAAGVDVEAAVGLHGYVYIDRDTHQATRIWADSEDFPAGFPLTRASTVLDYDYTQIEGRGYLLPLRVEIRMDGGPHQSLNSVLFQNYRKFSAETSVTFEPPPKK